MLCVVDVHTHLTSSEFERDIDAVLERCRATPCSLSVNGSTHSDRDSTQPSEKVPISISKVIVVTENSSDISSVLSLCQRSPILFPSIGLHPVQPGNTSLAHDEDLLQSTKDLVEEHQDCIVCIGEVGLDFSPHVVGKKTDPETERKKEAQREMLKAQARWALEFNLPLNVHSRMAGHHAVSLLNESGVVDEGGPGVLLHAFDGRAAVVRNTLALSERFHFSVPPSIMREPSFERLVKLVPLERLHLESDSPALGPEKGERNEPSNLRLTVKRIAEIKGISEEEVCRTTYENSLRLFPRLQRSKKS
eukprot:TRINITY_DN1884_c0_g1_i3.p1 TRINITY_DN1884_c0_g1~~TRINITY_DN1884_c0_g1_i3.p1  ORF type:complete len:306 (+),score=39.92 TRINITY_DN1884_c0_g1_i3:495-1412(+)